jgi:xanthine dehydrogenase accessory factor
MSELYALLQAAIRADQPIASITVVAAPAGVGNKALITPAGWHAGELGDAALTARATAEAQALLADGATRLVQYDDLGVTLFIESFVPQRTLFMVGGVHIAIGLAALAKVLGFRTVIVDARPAFANEERFSHVDELVVAWPDEALTGRLNAHSCVAVLTHDPKLDDPALHVALRSPAAYIGALGSPSTHAKRLDRLREAGFNDAELARIHGPIGLKIGAKTPEEIAVSILGEIVQVLRGKK